MQATEDGLTWHQSRVILETSQLLSVFVKNSIIFLLLLSLLGATTPVGGQQSGPPSRLPSEKAADEQDPVRVFTEEVRLQVLAQDQYGNFDPTLELDDVLILEDGIAQQIRSIRKIPSNLLIVLDTGGEATGLGGMSKRVDLTRDVALELLTKVNQDAWVAVMQFNNKVELIQPWTRDRQALTRSIKRKVSSGKRALFSDAVSASAKQLNARPEGTRHVVFITDGVDSEVGKSNRVQAVKDLIEARATVHIISYTEFVRQKEKSSGDGLTTRQLPPSSDPITATDPTLPPGTTRSPTYGVGIRFDPAMRRQRKAYENAVRQSQLLLKEIADETGGRIVLPISRDEMISQARDVAKEIGAEYVITYQPKRPLASASPGEYRRIEVASRRVGLNLRSRRGYVVPRQLAGGGS